MSAPSVSELHALAMIYLDLGTPAEALKIERGAIERFEAVHGPLGPEPSRSVLYASAASIATFAGDRVAAVAFAREGLAGNPPDDVRAELAAYLEPAR